jgi:hypothetical protein
MIRRSFILHTLGLVFFLTSAETNQMLAANMRSFNEAIRKNAAVVYVGSVKEVSHLKRTKFDIKAHAVVNVSKVLRGPVNSPPAATIEYSSFDEKTPMLEGGPQYQLQPGDQLVIFAGSFASTIPPGYLIQGKREDLLKRVEALRDALRQMSAGQLRLNEINEEDRRLQLALYQKLCTYLDIH